MGLRITSIASHVPFPPWYTFKLFSWYTFQLLFTEFVWLKDCRLKLQAWGGDQSHLTGLLGEHKPDGTRTFSLDF